MCRAQDVWTGSRAHGGEARVALDVGIVCPHAQSHIRSAAEEVLGAAEKYCKQKCEKDGTERKCSEMGIVYQPLIFESPGGIASEAEKVISCIHRVVAEQTETPYGEVAQRFWQRLSVDIQRMGHRAYARRAGVRKEAWGDGMEWVVDSVAGLASG